MQYLKMNILQKEQKANVILRKFNSTIKTVQKCLKPFSYLNKFKTDRIKNVQRKNRDLQNYGAQSFKQSHQYMNYWFPTHETEPIKNGCQRYKSKSGSLSHSRKSNNSNNRSKLFQNQQVVDEYQQKQFEEESWKSKMIKLEEENLRLKSENRRLKNKIKSFCEKYQQAQEDDFINESPIRALQQMHQNDQNNYRKKKAIQLRKGIQQQIQYLKARIRGRQNKSTKFNQPLQRKFSDNVNKLWEQFIAVPNASDVRLESQNIDEDNYKQIIISRPKYYHNSGRSTQRSRPLTTSSSAYPLTSRNR